MKPDVLERLLMDNALGRLDPDVEVLLADHLDADPAAASQAKELQSVVNLATEVIRTPSPTLGLPHHIRPLVWRYRAEQALALAASFVIGMTATALVLHANSRRENVAALHMSSTPNLAVEAGSRTALVTSKIDSLPFWSNQRAYLLAAVTSKTKTEVDSKEILK